MNVDPIDQLTKSAETPAVEIDFQPWQLVEQWFIPFMVVGVGA